MWMLHIHGEVLPNYFFSRQTIKFGAFFQWWSAFKQHTTNQKTHTNWLILDKFCLMKWLWKKCWYVKWHNNLEEKESKKVLHAFLAEQNRSAPCSLFVGLPKVASHPGASDYDMLYCHKQGFGRLFSKVQCSLVLSIYIVLEVIPLSLLFVAVGNFKLVRTK